jgi:hypothetical protein
VENKLKNKRFYLTISVTCNNLLVSKICSTQSCTSASGHKFYISFLDEYALLSFDRCVLVVFVQHIVSQILSYFLLKFLCKLHIFLGLLHGSILTIREIS